MFIFHETSLKNLEMILNSGVILRSSEHQKQSLNNHRQGSKNKKLSRDISLLLNTDNMFLVDEIDAVYCRLLVNHKLDKSLKDYFVDDCMIFLNPKILKKNKFIFNTEENSGFRIDKDWKINISPISGEPGLSISNYKDLKVIAKYLKFNCFRTEISILNNINIKYIHLIIIKGDFNKTINDICEEKKIKLIYI